MNSKDRVLTAIHHEEPDRVPMDYMYNPGIDARLKNHFNLAEDDNDGLCSALGVDFRRVDAPYVGPELHEPEPERLVSIWGIRRRWVKHDSGGYWDYCDFPLRDASLEDIMSWPLPNPDDFDYAALTAACRKHHDCCVVYGSPGLGDVMNKTGMLRGVDQAMMGLATEEPAQLALMDRKVDIDSAVLERVLDAADGGVDLIWMGEDLGTQRGPIISLAMFRNHVRPRLQKIVDVAKAFGVPVMIHSCGSSSWAFPDFIEMGIQVVDTLQPEAKDMEPAHLKREFGNQLSFHGMISTGGAVATGRVDDVVNEVRETLDIMMPGGGYCLVTSHQLQDNSPTENVLAMYEAGRTYGVY